MYVDDCTAVCEIHDEMADAFRGDRMGNVIDYFSHVWAIATSKWILTEDEMKQKEKEWLKSMGI